MSVLLDPATQLTFSRPFSQNVIRTLVVKNPNLEPIAFKVKTTAPKQYCVRPNSGRIEANQTVDVQVILQAMKEDPPPDYKCKDKFLVQSIPIAPEQENLSLQDLWTITEKQAKGSIKENKIRCVYSSPITTIDNANHPQQPTSHSSPQNLSVDNHTNNNSDKRHSTDSDISNAMAFDSRSVLSNITNGNHNSHKDDQKSSNKLNNYNSNNNDNQTNQSEDTNIDKLRRQLSEAQEEIKRLNHRIEEYKLETNTQNRQRNKIEQQPLLNKNNTPSGIGISVKTQEKVPEGYYPFEVVIGAAIGAFIFGVLFF